MKEKRQNRVSRRRFLQRGLWLATGGVLGGFGLWRYATQVEPEWLQIERVRIPIHDLASSLDGLRLVQLTDLHMASDADIPYLEQMVAATNSLSPDVILLTGDYVTDSARVVDELSAILSKLIARYGVFGVLGNHDMWHSPVVVNWGLRQAGVHMLHNRSETLTINGSDICITGMADAWSDTPDLDIALLSAPEHTPIVLMAHEPDMVDQYASNARISLQLSGHSHGGQVHLPLIGSPILPWMGRKYPHGLYRVNQTWLYTSRGIGNSGLNLRLNCRPEITELTLVSDERESES